MGISSGTENIANGVQKVRFAGIPKYNCKHTNITSAANVDFALIPLSPTLRDNVFSVEVTTNQDLLCGEKGSTLAEGTTSAGLGFRIKANTKQLFTWHSPEISLRAVSTAATLVEINTFMSV